MRGTGYILRFMVVVMALASASCSRRVSEAVLTTASEVTEVTVRERIITDTVVVPGDRVYIEVPIPAACDEVLAELLAVQESTRASVRVETRSGQTATSPSVLRITADCKEYEAQIHRLEKETESLRSSVKDTQTTTVVRERYVPAIYKWGLGISITMMILLLLYAVYKALKLYFKIKLPF